MKNTKLQNPSLRKRKGFTLIELIVVIAILAILAAIAVPTFLNALKNAKEKADVSSARTIVSAAALYIAENPTVDPATETWTIDLLDDYLDGVDPVSQTNNATFVISYDSGTGSFIVDDGITKFYPLPVAPVA